MDKICNIAILLGFIVAIVGAFVAIPNLVAILLVLGAVGGLNTAEKPDYRLRVYAAAAVLLLGSHLLSEIPAAGAALTAIFSGVAAVFVGFSVVAIVLAIATQVKKNLMT